MHMKQKSETAKNVLSNKAAVLFSYVGTLNSSVVGVKNKIYKSNSSILALSPSLEASTVFEK